MPELRTFRNTLTAPRLEPFLLRRRGQVHMDADTTMDKRFDLRRSEDAIVAFYHAMLTDAFNERQRQVGGDAVMLDALLEIAQAKGFPGGRALAMRVLQVVGRFNVGSSPGGRVGVWRKS
jgi:hypothetical protein